MARTLSYRVFLSKKERKIIRHLQKKATSPNARTRYAILLAADENAHEDRLTNYDIANASGASVPTVIHTLREFCESGLGKAIKPSRTRIPIPRASRLPATWRQK